MKRLSAEELADFYWFKMRRAAIKEVQFKISQSRDATPGTTEYWVRVLCCLERKAAIADDRRERNRVLQ